MSDDDGSGLTTYLAEHPRMIGVLFTITLLLSQATPVMAGGTNGTTAGP